MINTQNSPDLEDKCHQMKKPSKYQYNKCKSSILRHISVKFHSSREDPKCCKRETNYN